MKRLIFLTILTIQTLNLHTPPRWLWLHTGPKTWAKPTTTGCRVWPCTPAKTGWTGAVVAVACTERLTLVPARTRSTGGTAWGGCLLLASKHTHHPPTTLQSSLCSSHHGRVQTEGTKISQTTVSAAPQPTTAATKRLSSKTISKPCCTIKLPIAMFGLSVWDVNTDSFDNKVLSTERLGDLRGKKRENKSLNRVIPDWTTLKHKAVAFNTVPDHLQMWQRQKHGMAWGWRHLWLLHTA